ncbi:hypothetical protein NPIL_305841 [Nephila pilipes]|uniref:Uncharacterized protein n=1 Tax=Nephila pilipes TaxID=299642 RepID=A0A8X6TY68_NEPPI|nr:hypothetical protein NPIL_305841 [Nephila pilipes]
MSLDDIQILQNEMFKRLYITNARGGGGRKWIDNGGGEEFPAKGLTIIGGALRERFFYRSDSRSKHPASPRLKQRDRVRVAVLERWLDQSPNEEIWRSKKR